MGCAGPVTGTWYQHAMGYAEVKWPHLAPHSRASLADALATVTPLLMQRCQPWQPLRHGPIGPLMPQILDHFLQAAYGQVCLADQDAVLPADSDRASAQVLADATAIVVCVAGQEPENAVEIEVYHGAGEAPRLTGLEPVFTGLLALSQPGMLIFAPTGEEVLMPEIPQGPHPVAIYRDGYPASRLVVLIDGPGTATRQAERQQEARRGHAAGAAALELAGTLADRAVRDSDRTGTDQFQAGSKRRTSGGRVGQRKFSGGQ